MYLEFCKWGVDFFFFPIEEEWPSKLKHKQLWFVQSVDVKSCQALLTRESWRGREKESILARKWALLIFAVKCTGTQATSAMPNFPGLSSSPWARCWLRCSGHAGKALLYGWECCLFSPEGTDSSTPLKTLGGEGSGVYNMTGHHLYLY